jgi:hypothetical protein
MLSKQMSAAEKVPTEQIEILCIRELRDSFHLINPAPVVLVNVFCVV